MQYVEQTDQTMPQAFEDVDSVRLIYFDRQHRNILETSTYNFVCLKINS